MIQDAIKNETNMNFDEVCLEVVNKFSSLLSRNSEVCCAFFLEGDYKFRDKYKNSCYFEFEIGHMYTCVLICIEHSPARQT